LRALGVPVHDADAVVHRLMAKGGAAVRPIDRAFPEVVSKGVVDRRRLSLRVFGDDAALRRLEAILHPLVRLSERRFLQNARRRRLAVVALDIPLLFEVKGEGRVDAVVVVTCPAFLQEQRVLARPGMTAQRLAAIRARQMPDGDKRRRADVIIQTGGGRRLALRNLRIAVKLLQQNGPSHRRRRPIITALKKREKSDA
jgi:dephospho-CoA kinase